MQPLAIVGLIAFGVAAVVGGVITWRTAEKLVTDARQQLRAMFGEQHPAFSGEPDPRGARMAGIGFIAFGVVLLAVAAFQLLA